MLRLGVQKDSGYKERQLRAASEVDHVLDGSILHSGTHQLQNGIVVVVVAQHLALPG